MRDKIKQLWIMCKLYIATQWKDAWNAAKDALINAVIAVFKLLWGFVAAIGGGLGLFIAGVFAVICDWIVALIKKA